MNLLRFFVAASLFLALTCVSQAMIVLDIGISQDAGGADITVKASADASMDPYAYGGWQVPIQLDNFVGFAGPVTISQTPLPLQPPLFPSTANGPANDGDVIQNVTLVPASTLTTVMTNLYSLRIDVPGGFLPGRSFDVSVLQNNGPSFETAVGNAVFSPGFGQDQLVYGNSLPGGASPVTVAAVPEVSSFLMLGLALASFGGFTWLKRSRKVS